MQPIHPCAPYAAAGSLRRVLAAGLTSVTLVLAAGCAGGSGSTPAPDRHPVSSAAAVPTTTGPAPSATGTGTATPGTGTPGMAPGPASGMDDAVPADGLTAQADGLRLAELTTSLPADRPGTLRFQIRGTDGTPVTAFRPDQTELMHLYLIRSDLTGFQHVHPAMAADGTWTADLAPSPPGTYRMYASFTAHDAGRDVPLVLSEPITVPGSDSAVPLPPASTTTTVDGYTLAFSTAGTEPMAGTHLLTVTVSRDGRPVTDLQPYLGAYAHLSAFHAGDLAFAHLHPQGPTTGGAGGPALTFMTRFPWAGSWRLFVQFRTGGTLHTGELTLPVG